MNLMLVRLVFSRYECLVVFGHTIFSVFQTGAGLGQKKCGMGWCARRERAKFLKLLWVRGGFKFCGCGEEADKKFQPAQDSIAHTKHSCIESDKLRQTNLNECPDDFVGRRSGQSLSKFLLGSVQPYLIRQL